MTISKVLLVDDSVTMHRAVALSLKKENIDLVSCDNGQDGLRLARELQPLVVLADLDMPGMTGIELCQAIKSDPTLAKTKVILLCGSFDQVDESRLESVPADGRLWKPFESHVLVTLINGLQRDAEAPPEAGDDATAPIPRSVAVSGGQAETSYRDIAQDMTQETFLGLAEPHIERTAEKQNQLKPLSTPDEATLPPDESQNLWGAPTPKVRKQETLSRTLPPKAPLAQTMQSIRKELTTPRSISPGADIGQFRAQEKTQPMAPAPGVVLPPPMRPTPAAPAAPAISEARIRQMIREEIDAAVTNELRDRLQAELAQIIAEIENS